MAIADTTHRKSSWRSSTRSCPPQAPLLSLPQTPSATVRRRWTRLRLSDFGRPSHQSTVRASSDLSSRTCSTHHNFDDLCFTPWVNDVTLRSSRAHLRPEGFAPQLSTSRITLEKHHLEFTLGVSGVLQLLTAQHASNI